MDISNRSIGSIIGFICYVIHFNIQINNVIEFRWTKKTHTSDYL